MSQYCVNFNYTNNSLIQANISDQIAEQGEWTSKLTESVSNGGGHTSGQVCGTAVKGSLKLMFLGGTHYKVNFEITSDGSISVTAQATVTSCTSILLKLETDIEGLTFSISLFT
eukprot:Em0105g11a